MFWGTGQGLFFNASEHGTQRFFVFYGTGHELFFGKNLSNYIL